MTSDDAWSIDPSQLPQPLELELPADQMEWLQRTAAKTGRSVEELILELIDQALQERRAQ